MEREKTLVADRTGLDWKDEKWTSRIEIASEISFFIKVVRAVISHCLSEYPLIGIGTGRRGTRGTCLPCHTFLAIVPPFVHT